MNTFTLDELAVLACVLNLTDAPDISEDELEKSGFTEYAASLKTEPNSPYAKDVFDAIERRIGENTVLKKWNLLFANKAIILRAFRAIQKFPSPMPEDYPTIDAEEVEEAFETLGILPQPSVPPQEQKGEVTSLDQLTEQEMAILYAALEVPLRLMSWEKLKGLPIYAPLNQLSDEIQARIGETQAHAKWVELQASEPGIGSLSMKLVTSWWDKE